MIKVRPFEPSSKTKIKKKKTIVIPSYGLNGFNVWSFRPGPEWRGIFSL